MGNIFKRPKAPTKEKTDPERLEELKDIQNSLLESLKDRQFVFGRLGWYSPFELMQKYGQHTATVRHDIVEHEDSWFFQRWWRVLRTWGTDNDIILKQHAYKYREILDEIARNTSVIKWDYTSHTYSINPRGFYKNNIDKMRLELADNAWLESIGHVRFSNNWSLYHFSRKVINAFKRLKKWFNIKKNTELLELEPESKPPIDLTAFFESSEPEIKQTPTDEKSTAPQAGSPPPKLEDYCAILVPPHMNDRKFTLTSNMIVLEKGHDGISASHRKAILERNVCQSVDEIAELNELQFPDDQPSRITYKENPQLIKKLTEVCECIEPPEPPEPTEPPFGNSERDYMYYCALFVLNPNQPKIGKKNDYYLQFHPDKFSMPTIADDDECRKEFTAELNKAYNRIIAAHDKFKPLLTKQIAVPPNYENTYYWNLGVKARETSTREYFEKKKAECLSKAQPHAERIEKDRQLAKTIQTLLSQEKQTRGTEQHSQFVEKLQQHFEQLDKKYPFINTEQLPSYDRPDPTLVRAYEALQSFITRAKETPSPKGSASSDSETSVSSARKVSNPLMADVSGNFVVSNPSSTDASPRSTEEKNGADLSSASATAAAEIAVGGASP